MQTAERQTKRNDRGILVTFLKVRRLPKQEFVNGKWFEVGGDFAVINSNDRSFEPGGTHWPHLYRGSTFESADAYARACCRPHPEYGQWYELADDATQADIIARLDAGELYDEGTPLEAAILAHCRATGRDIEWNDGRGCITCFGDVEGRAQ